MDDPGANQGGGEGTDPTMETHEWCRPTHPTPTRESDLDASSPVHTTHDRPSSQPQTIRRTRRTERKT